MLGARTLVPILAERTIVRGRERYRFLPVRTEVLESVGGEQRGDMRGRGHTRSQRQSKQFGGWRTECVQ